MTKQVIKKTVTPKYHLQEFDVSIVKGESVNIKCFYENHHTPKNWDNTFKVGDMAEYDSYNLKYYGEIVSITENTVTIKPKYSGSCSNKRLKMGDFCQKNFDFDLEKVKAYNAEESMYI